MVRFKKFHTILWLEGVEVCVCTRGHAQTHGVRGIYLQTCICSMDP